MKKFLKNLFIRNWELKLFSLLIALVLWFTLIPEEKIFSEKNLTVPLELYNTPPGMELVEKPPATVDVKIRASRSLIDQITPTNVHAVLNLEKARLDQREYPINESMISLPAGAEVKDIFPSQVNLTLERTKEIQVDIEPNIIGQLKEGYEVEAVRIIPAKVLIRGPESKVKDNSKARTSPIDITGLDETTEFEVAIIPPNPEVRLASSQSKVKVTVLVRKAAAEPRESARRKKPKL